MKRAIPRPTAAQQAHQDAQRAVGCAVCLYRIQHGMQSTWCGPPEIHHRTIGDMHGQKQLGQDATVCLGSWHHRGQTLPLLGLNDMRWHFGPSFALHARDFRVWTADVLGDDLRGTEAWQNWQDAQIRKHTGAAPLRVA